MAKADETSELDHRTLLKVLTAVGRGDFSVRMPPDRTGLAGKICDALNEVIDFNEQLASELVRVSTAVGKEGKIAHRAALAGGRGGWLQSVEAVNELIGDLVQPTSEMARVIGAVARGDLSQSMSMEIEGRRLKGEFLRTAGVVNTMVDQLASFASEVTRVAREVGTEGKLGGQAVVKGVSGTWKDLTDNVNLMASNLTGQVRNIAEVTKAVARGDLSKKIAVDVRGEMLELKDTMNTMVDQLRSFASEMTRVAREVGIEGKLGGQAQVPGASGTWRDLIDHVNQLAANLNAQVRAIAEVATAVTKGDLTQIIYVLAQGEVEALKNNINQMILNLRDTTQKNQEQDWLKTNLTKFTQMLQGHRDLEAVARLILKELAPLVAAQHGVFFLMHPDEASGPVLRLLASYAYRERRTLSSEFKVGEGLVGQCALEKERILVTEVPEDYVRIGSGLGEGRPLNIVVLPVLFEGEVKAVIELASFYRFSDIHLDFLDQLTESIGIVLNTIAASMRTEETNRRLEEQTKTLKASEERLRSQQEELQQTNEELEERSRLLLIRNEEVERKNKEIETARNQLEEKAKQLALTSKYKSEFLANMSHELRTPLNSLLILSRLLADNPDGNLTPKQVEFAQTIYAAGSDLLSLINDVLDHSKIESGTMVLDLEEVPVRHLREYVERTFRQNAVGKGLEFTVELANRLPAGLHTDGRRLKQVLKNLLSNAFKFTEQGSVRMRVELATGGWAPDCESLNRAERVVAFSVTDTGIGIPQEKQRIIFEAFQQADGSTARKYGGTGLGLSISREISRMLGGDIQLVSEPGKGSTFTLYLPASYQAPARPQPAGAPAGPPPAQAAGSGAPEPEVDPALLEVNELADDRDAIRPGDRTLLIVEDDIVFARILLGLAREKGFKGLVALRGDTGLALARKHQPDAITLDVGLPVLDGWKLLDRLKHDSRTRHIPVHVISASEEDRTRSLRQGALAHLPKPVTQEAVLEALAKVKTFIERPMKSLLVVEDDDHQRQSIAALIGNGDVNLTLAASAREALEVLSRSRVDCLVLDLGLPDMDGTELIEKLKALQPDLPVIVYTGKELSEEEETRLKRMTESIIIKSVKSPEHLLDETALFLHRVESKLPEAKRQMIQQIQMSDPVLAGKTVLVVDDDVRNVFAITSVLERHQMKVLFAENGKKGIAAVEAATDLDLVLMDVMMPEMDGFEAMQQIRRRSELKGLPIIALTAKAMKGDREKCIEAGASDYITKPVDTEQLLSLLRVWLYRGSYRPQVPSR
jgi:CheY-like chemotaxis protein/signal transduction histidine kinase/HAMP domain-containing protein